MKTLPLLKLFAVFSLGLTLLFGAGHALVATNAMYGMMNQEMPISQCQSSCTPQSSAGLSSQKLEAELDKDLDPQPAEPDYLAFIGSGWTNILTVAAAYLLAHRRWRPPDLFKLNVNYRF